MSTIVAFSLAWHTEQMSATLALKFSAEYLNILKLIPDIARW